MRARGVDEKTIEAILVLWGEYTFAHRDSADRGYFESTVTPSPGWTRSRIGEVCVWARQVEQALLLLDGKLALILRQKYQQQLPDEEARRDIRLQMGRDKYAKSRREAVSKLSKILMGKKKL